jgi:hypothetical protein
LEEELAREAIEVKAVRRAASAGLRHLLPYLSCESERRRSVAAALGNYQEHTAWALPAIDAAMETETEEDVREALAESKRALQHYKDPSIGH